MPKIFLMVTAAGLAMTSATAFAQDSDVYIAGNVGAVFMGDSDNSGRLNENFEIPLAGATLADGGVYKFDTDFELGGFASIAVGKNTVYGPFRSELEISYTRNEIKSHGQLQALGMALDGTDAGILLGLDEPVGLNAGRVLEDAQGKVGTWSAMVNGFYDFPVPAEAVRPYVGVGLGATWVNVDYSPSGIDLIDDDAVTFGYQAMAGVDYELNNSNILHAGVRYRGANPVDVNTDALFDSELEIDLQQFIVEVGYRWAF